MKPFLNSIFALICFFSFLTPCVGAPTNLQPHEVVIQSEFKQQSEVPGYSKHTFDLQKLEISGDPFFPKFTLINHALPEGFGRNTNIAGLSSFSAGLAKVFLGNKGLLDAGIIEFYTGKKEVAKAEFQAIIDNPDETTFKDLAKLWLARIAYFENRKKDAAQYFKLLHGSSDNDIKQESLYFSSLLLIQQKKYLQQLEFVKSIAATTLPVKQWDFRLLYATLVSHVNLKQWKDAKILLKEIEKRPFSHQQLFYKVKQIFGIVNYALNDYDDALKEFTFSKNYYPIPQYQRERSRNIAWIQYILGNYKGSLTTIKNNFKSYQGQYLQELKYLSLVNLMRLNQWEKVDQALIRLPKSSIFYIYAAYQIRSNLKDVGTFKNLYNKVSLEQYNFPIMKFNVALLNGNHYFEKDVLDGAQSQYIKALSVDIESKNEWIAQYNLSLAYLKKMQFKKAQASFIQSAKLIPKKITPWFYYHILYLVYQQNHYAAYLKNFVKANITKFDPLLMWELEFMRAGSFLATGKNQEAINLFIKVWKDMRYFPAIIHAIKTQYQEKQFKAIIQLVNQYPVLNQNDELFTYKIKSLLGLQQFKIAQTEIEKHDFKKDRLIKIRLEVWFANNSYEKIIQTIPPLLKTASDREKRLIYYTSMGDAYFSLQAYLKSKSQFYKALQLTDDINKRSPMLYNIVLGTHLYKDYTSFLKEANLTLKEERLTDDVRYSITMLLSDYYFNNGKANLADRVLGFYTRNFNYQKTKTHNKRLLFLYQKGSYAGCFKNARQPVDKEDAFQRRDRIVLLGHCSKTEKQAKPAIEKLEKELADPENTYRKEELEYVLSLAYYYGKEHQNAISSINRLKNKLTPELLFKTQFMLTNSHLSLKQPDMAEQELGDLNQYRENKTYIEALYLKSKIKQAQNEPNLAIRTLLRIYYLPETKKISQQVILLKIVNIYFKSENIIEAEKYFKEVNYKQIKKEKQLDRLYIKLKSLIEEKLLKVKGIT
jgi:tetratricopeptide (TPR) repeat protein